MKAGNSSTIDRKIEYHSNPAVVDMGLYKEAESSPGAGEPNDFGVNAFTGMPKHNGESAGGLLYPNPAANLVGE